MLSLNYWALATGLCKHFGDFFEPCFFQGAFWAQEDGALKSQRFCKAFIHLNCFWRSCAHNGGAKIWECRLTLRDRDSHMEFSLSRFGLLTKISDIKPRNKKKPPKTYQLCISVFSTGLIFLGRIENCIQTFPISEFPHEGHQALHASNLCTIFFAQMFREVFGLTGGGGQQHQMFCFLFFNGERSAILTLFSTWIAIVRYKKRPPKMHYPTITPFSWFVCFATSNWGFPLSTLGAWNLPVWKLVLGEENSSLPGSPNSFFIIPFILLKESLVEQLPIYGHRKAKE